MVEEIRKKEKITKRYPRRRRPPKLEIENQLLLTLMYWREYRTMFHIATDYGISEASVSRIVTKVEDILSQSKKLQLPGKKALAKAPDHFEVVLIDTTETPIERPKKTAGLLFRKKEKAYPKNTSDGTHNRPQDCLHPYRQWKNARFRTT